VVRSWRTECKSPADEKRIPGWSWRKRMLISFHRWVVRLQIFQLNPTLLPKRVIFPQNIIFGGTGLFRGTGYIHCEIALSMGPSSRRLTHFVAAALPKVPMRALKLGDRTSLAHDIRGLPTGLRRARSTSAAAPPVRFRGLVWPGRFTAKRAFFFSLEKCPIVTAAHAFRGGGTHKVPYMRLKARRQDLLYGRYAWIGSRV